ncbi:MAG TPA: ribonuclease H [Polyangia bacterium]|nr:ribonuclease H [Polyangia bacterium]
MWVNVDGNGRPVLDRDGRAEMKYRESDSKTYRPGPANLTPDPTAGPPRELPAGGATDDAGSGKKARHGGAPATDGDALQIWTDGACSGNPGPMGIGVVIIDGKEREEAGEFLGVGTNNIAELVAIERGLALATKRVTGNPDRRVRVYSDSSYAIGLLEKNWKAKANQELVARLRRKLTAFPAAVEFVKVAGHAGVPENERCDELGRQAINRSR